MSNPELINITESGVYRLRLCPLKSEKIIETEDGLVARLFFLGEAGLCLTKKYQTRYGSTLATLIGKLSGKYMKPIDAKVDKKTFMDYIAPAINKWADYDITVTANEYNGKIYQNYKFNSITPFILEVEDTTPAQESPQDPNTGAPPF